jgi:hypothetical protein
MKLFSLLNRQRNACIKAGYLPDEVICEIISYGGLFSAVQGSHVCHRWRLAALSNPRLWSEIQLISTKINQKLLSAQFERSKAYPLCINLGQLSDYSSLLPREITLSRLLAKSGTITHLTTLALENSQIDGSFSMPHLESLHVTFHSQNGAQRLQCIRNSPRLRQLSINARWAKISEALLLTPGLHTLHITAGKDHPNALLSLLNLMSGLKELCLRSMDIDNDETGMNLGPVVTEAFPTLDSISMSNCTIEYLSQMLIPRLVSSHTNLQIDVETDDPQSERFPLNCHREGASSLWVDQDRTTFVFHHAKSITDITLATYAEVKTITPILAFINGHSITSLFLRGGEPLAPNELGILPNLTHFNFLLQILAVRTNKRTISTTLNLDKRMLGDTLNSNLPIFCPRLVYIGLILQKNSSKPMTQDDQVDKAIENFLESWVETHGKRFGTIRIQDEIKPSRWGEIIPRLKDLTEAFELGTVTGFESEPDFPTMRKFASRLPRSKSTEGFR